MIRDLVEVRSWARELADDPVLRGRPQSAAVLGAAAYAAYAAGELDRAEEYARAGLVEGGDGVRHCRHALAVTALARGAWDEAVEHSLAPDAVGPSAARLPGYWRRWPAPTRGDLDRARAFNGQWLAVASSPSRLAWATYYQAEIENLSHRPELAEQRYLEAMTLGRNGWRLLRHRGRDHRTVHPARPRGTGAGGPGRLSRSDRAVRAYRLLDPPMDHPAQPGGPAATAGRCGDGRRHRGRGRRRPRRPSDPGHQPAVGGR